MKNKFTKINFHTATFTVSSFFYTLNIFLENLSLAFHTNDLYKTGPLKKEVPEFEYDKHNRYLKLFR
jgi:hypothetical protein